MKNSKKLGFTLSYDFVPPALSHDLIQMLDNSGFTHVFVPEVWGYDALLECARMADHSEQLIFGTGIINMYSRSPATMAQAAASIFEQTDGRFILGLGLSGPKVIQNWHGMNYNDGSPMQRTREYLEIIRLILSGEEVNYSGKSFKLKGFKLRTFESPVRVPLYLAAFGNRNIQLAGELADGWLPIWTSFPELPDVRKSFEKGLTKRSKNLGSDLEISPYIVTCASEDIEQAKSLVRRQLAFYIGGMGTYYSRIVKQYGFIAEVDRITKAWQNGQKELAINEVTDTMLTRLAVVGSPDYVLTRYEILRKNGVTLPVVWLPVKCPPSLALETINTFTEA
ncbi:MAG: LLM class flavin-dependent oxidoreductase [Candidatus Heimdallarchaeota archaeon]|nr:LLM class flavin-dependent oxidoreductase [Candidatus Heimdallarchaeota archaeon]